MIGARLVTKILQRYWRQSRGLKLEVRGVVRDAGGRVMLVREAAGSWCLPGAAVPSGMAAEMALRRYLEHQCGLEITAPARIFAVYAEHRADTTAHVVVFLVQSWHRSENGGSSGESCSINLTEPDRLPLDLEPGSLKCIGDVIARRQRSELW